MNFHASQEGPVVDQGPLRGMNAGSLETAVGGYGTPSSAMAHIAYQSQVVQERWDWINAHAQQSAVHPPEVY